MKLIERSRNVVQFKPTIVIIGFSRENHFAKVVESVVNLSGINNFNICFVIQKSFSRVMEIAENSNLSNKSIFHTDFESSFSAKKKINSNVFSGLKFAFDDCQSPYVVVLEDDTVLLRDSLLFFDKIHHEYKNSVSFRGINGFSDKANTFGDGELENYYLKGNFGLGWGWSINRRVFEELLKIWTGLEDDHWDAIIEPYIRTGFVINPIRSRVINLGLDGTGTNSRKSVELFDAMSLSSGHVSEVPLTYLEIENMNLWSFWRRDFFILSNRSTFYVNCLLFAFKCNFFFSKNAKRFPRIIIVRKIYTLYSKILLMSFESIQDFQQVVLKPLNKVK